MEWFAFHVGEKTFGMDADVIYRVVEDVKITPVPLVPTCHLGILYYRGDLFNVIDMTGLLGHGQLDLDKDLRIILIKWSDKKLALVPKNILGLLLEKEDEKEESRRQEILRSLVPITPDEIWNQLMELPYGPHKISEDLHPGVQ
jgi:chemotaxis signal transduction protein